MTDFHDTPAQSLPAAHPNPTTGLDALWRHVGAARWFSGKGRGGRLAGVQALDWLTPPDAAVRVRPEVLTVDYPDGSTEYYQLLASYRAEAHPDSFITASDDPELGMLHDAARDPEAMTLVVRALQSNAETPTWQAVSQHALSGNTTPRVFGGEQSNTNVMLGDVALLKVFRKLEPGRNLDIQVHDALGRAGVRAVARLHGWLAASATDRDGKPVGFDLMMLVEQLRNAEDGWELALQYARDDRDFSGHAARLGEALRTIHDALRDTFATETLEGSEVAATMRERLETATAAAPALSDHHDALVALFDRLDGRRLRAQRIHGDFHLGQTLHLRASGSDEAGNGGSWRIIDFEGEPMKQMWERVLPDSPWRDVAGMMRSFSYATSGFTDPLGERAQAWLTANRNAFLRAYAGRLQPEDATVLAAYEADKAVYEVVYETRNRPDWLGIPLAGIEQLTRAGRPSGGDQP